MVAGAIAIALGSVGGAAIIAAMGAGTLGVLAAQSSGGTVYYELQMERYNGLAQYRYLISFTANTGDAYGPYAIPVQYN